MRHSQDTNLHNEVLILNRSVPSLKVRREFQTQSCFLPCCLQTKRKKEVIKIEVLVTTGKASGLF